MQFDLPKTPLGLNIQEDIWKWLRKRITHNFLFDDPKSLAKIIRDGYRYLQAHPERVISLTGKRVDIFWIYYRQ